MERPYQPRQHPNRPAITPKPIGRGSRIIQPLITFSKGAKLGTYEIVGDLGAGGMGEVYRARDLKLKREVAIKVLPDAFLRDSERVSRFQREAEILASLNHPDMMNTLVQEPTSPINILLNWKP